MKRSIFYSILLLPSVLISAAVFYLFYYTNLPQLLYIQSIRNINFDCVEFTDDDGYVYKMKPGKCRLKNIEYDTVINHNASGYRVTAPAPAYEVTVLGDSHAYGFGVSDEDTFSYLLGSEHNYRTMNLSIGSYATMRELEALKKYGKDAKYIVLQYCDNDFGENVASLRLSTSDFKTQVNVGWKSLIENYYLGKSMGYKHIFSTLGNLIKSRAFLPIATWRSRVEERMIEQEADVFARILDRYRPLLEGKRLIILESSGHGLNSPKLVTAFSFELNKIRWLSYKIIDATTVLNFGDYFFFDDHLRPVGHRKLAAAVANQIDEWERDDPQLKDH